MIFKQNMIVVITNGKMAGKKAVVLKDLDNGMLLVAGITRTPIESPDFLPNWEKRKNEKFVTFIKKVNTKHVLATRYKAEVGLDKLSTEDCLDNINNRCNLNKEANKTLKDAFEAKKSKWLFTTLKF